MGPCRAGLLLVLAVFAGLLVRAGAAAVPPARSESAGRSAEHLRRVMDQFHQSYGVYQDLGSPANHFHVWARFPATAPVSMDAAWTAGPQSGATALRCRFTPRRQRDYGGFFFLNGVLRSRTEAPQPNFGSERNAGVDLSGAAALTFWARGERGGERVTFFMGGAGRSPATGRPREPFPDSTPAVRKTVRLKKTWTRYRLPLAGRNLRYVLAGFGWSVTARQNRRGAAFLVDSVEYELDGAARARRLALPRFLRSYAVQPVQPASGLDTDPDVLLRQVAYAYDNALCLLAFLAHGSADSLARARLLGDAFVYAATRDRTYTDGRVRDAYAAGDLALPPGWKLDGRAGTAAVPGYYDPAAGEFEEVFQGGLSTGNNAWVMTALLALARRTGEARYRDAALRIGRFLLGFRADTGTYRGFRGGLDAPETVQPHPRAWASVEHNLDAGAGFRLLASVTGDPSWLSHSEHAFRFVEAMWDEAGQCYLAGTVDPETRNTAGGQLPEDAQSWAVLADPSVLTRHPQVLSCLERRHRLTHHGFTGVDFNEDRDGVWFEGMGHAAAAYRAAGDAARADALCAELARAQATAPYGDGYGLSAACHDGVSSGFGFTLLRRHHVAAAAWNVFAQLGYEPYSQRQL